MKGHWVGIFTSKGNETEIDFTRAGNGKKFFMKPFVKILSEKQQTKFVAVIQSTVIRAERGKRL